MGDDKTSAALLVGTVAVGALTYQAVVQGSGRRCSPTPGAGAQFRSRLQPAKVQRKKKVPAELRKRGAEWIAKAGQGCNPVPRVLKEMGIDMAESPSGLVSNFVVDTVCAGRHCSVETLEQIERDLPRTYPDVSFFADTDVRDALGRVLRAVALEYADVGYVQGMNFLGANMLLHVHGSEDQTFQLFRYLMENPKFRLLHVFQPDLPNLKRFSDIMEHFLAVRFPALYRHFQAIGLEPLFYSQNWIMTLFAYMVPFVPLADIWDRFFEDGWPAIFRVALAFFQLNAPELLLADFEKAASLLRRTAEDPPENLCTVADSVELTRDDLKLIADAVAMRPINIPSPPPPPLSSSGSADFGSADDNYSVDTLDDEVTILTGLDTPESAFSQFRKSLSSRPSLGGLVDGPTFVPACSLAFGDRAADDETPFL